VALNTRSMIDPRWPFHQREVVAGSMLAYVEIAHPQTDAVEWNPMQGDVFDGTTDYVLHYQGPARIQPNVDWRARVHKLDGQIITEHAVRIQVPFNRNEITNPVLLPDQTTGALGIVHVSDVVRVLEGANLFGTDVDEAVTLATYVIRNISISSNEWTRILLCDVIVNNVTPLTGNGM
jgi:hypothetical protein